MTNSLKLIEKNDPETLEYWVKRVQSDELTKDVVATKAFRRLYRVSFLGALDHVDLPFPRSVKTRSRAAHSINVAALAAYVSSKRQYTPELTRHIVTAALLHDIGHAPLSHSVEPVIKATLGIGHHEQGEMILKGRHTIGTGLHECLSRHVDIDFVMELVDGKADNSVGGDLFSSPINIDTIEGIIRGYQYLAGRTYSLNPIKVARASLAATTPDRYRWLDKFWALKNLVYARFINEPLGLIADHYSRWYFDGGEARLSEGDIFADETQWARKYQRLFDNLKSISEKRTPPDSLKGVTVNYASRHYFIDNQSQGSARYRHVKQPARYTFANTPEYRPVQAVLV